MDELKFVFKCFIFAGLLFALSQYRSDGITLESHVHSFLISTPVSNFVNESAQGGAKFVRKSYEDVSKFIDGIMGKKSPQKEIAESQHNSRRYSAPQEQTRNLDTDLIEEDVD